MPKFLKNCVKIGRKERRNSEKKLLSLTFKKKIIIIICLKIQKNKCAQNLRHNRPKNSFKKKNVFSAKIQRK